MGVRREWIFLTTLHITGLHCTFRYARAKPISALWLHTCRLLNSTVGEWIEAMPMVPERKCTKQIMGIILLVFLSALYWRDTIWCVCSWLYVLFELKRHGSCWNTLQSTRKARKENVKVLCPSLEMVHQVHTHGSPSDLVGKFDIIRIHRARRGLLLPPFSLRRLLLAAQSPPSSSKPLANYSLFQM